MFLSPFVDLMMLGSYKEGMLAAAASEALSNLDSAPVWYILVILMMTFLSWGHRKGLEQIMSMFSLKKGK